MDRRELGAGTRVVRAARSLPPGTGEPVVPPLVQSVAFDYGSAAEQDAVFGNDRPGYVYGRYGTPMTARVSQWTRPSRRLCSSVRRRSARRWSSIRSPNI